MELTVVIPTHNRLAILKETLKRLGAQSGDVRFEVVVVDDGSSDGTVDAMREWAPTAPHPVELIAQAGGGPAAARNRAIALASAPVCLFLNDDSWPRPDLLARHRDHHARDPALEAALLGKIVLPSDPPPTPFMQWVAKIQFDFETIGPGSRVGGTHFFTANLSAKTEFLRAAGGFDEALTAAAHEDIDLGLRLEERGMRLVFDPSAVVEHCHPLDLPAAIARFKTGGSAMAPFTERHPGWAVPRRPGARHRVKAAALTAASILGIRTRALRRETWRFLCHEATREGYWDAVEGRPADRGLRIGARLARLAARDDDTRLPASRRPDAARSELELGFPQNR